MKKLLLFTIPHTGTNTMHYLFGVLGKVEVYWCHFHAPSANKLRDLFRLEDPGDAVYMMTERDDENLRDSWKRRKRKGFKEEGVQAAFTMRDKYKPLLVERGCFIMPIEGTTLERSLVALSVMDELGIEPKKPFLKFIETWPYFNAHATSNIENFKVAKGRSDSLSASLRNDMQHYLDLHKGE
jgi:hypothetical protein